MKFRRAFLAFLVTVCLLALVGLAPVSIRAQYSYQDKVLGIDSSNLWAYWGLDETSGTTADDLTANNRDGTYNGPTLASVAAAGAGWANAPSFDGINDNVSLPALDISNASFTFAAWVKVTDVAASRSVIALSDINAAQKQAFLSITVTTGTVRLGFNSQATITTATIDTGWHHLAGTYDSISDISKVYIDGVEQASGAAGPMITAGSAFYIGFDNIATTYFYGAIDEVAVWTSALSVGDIEIIASPDGLPTPTPTATNPTNTPTATLEFGSHIVLSSGQVGALYYKIDSGAVLLALLLLLQIGLLLALLALRMWRRG